MDGWQKYDPDCLEELQKYGANLLMGNDEN